MPSWCNCSQSNGWVTCWWWYWWRMKQIRSVRSGCRAGPRRGVGPPGLAVGGQPAFAAVADDAGLEDQILNDEVFVSFEDGPGRAVGQRDDDLVGDGQLGGLGAAWRSRAVLARVAGRPGRRLEGTGGDPGSGLETLEAERSRLRVAGCALLLRWRMISSSCRTSGVRSASGMSGSGIRMARFYQLAGRFTRVIVIIPASESKSETSFLHGPNPESRSSFRQPTPALPPLTAEGAGGPPRLRSAPRSARRRGRQDGGRPGPG